MSKDLKNKTVVITGAASGLGFEIADKFLQNGAKFIIVLDIKEQQGADAVKTLNSKYGDNRSTFMKCDVRSDLEEIFRKIIDEYKYIDVLVNNAGIMDESSPKMTMDINVTALIEWSLKFWNHMRKDLGGNGGTIMNLGSIYGFRMDPFFHVYKASKFAVMGFTRSLGHPYNFNKTGVRVISINPSFTESSLGTGGIRCKIMGFLDKQHEEDVMNFIKTQTFQKAEAVGRAAVDVFERAETGTAWMVEGAQPIVEVKYKTDEMHEINFDRED